MSEETAREESPSPGQLRPIAGFHQDECGDWIADLSCGHSQHLRHRPPWELRPWVITQEGRQLHIGRTLVCNRCISPDA